MMSILSSSVLQFLLLIWCLCCMQVSIDAFSVQPHSMLHVHAKTSSASFSTLQPRFSHVPRTVRRSHVALEMNIVQDAFRFFTNLKKEASAKHILKTGANANQQLTVLKKELEGLKGEELSNAFSELAAKVS